MICKETIRESVRGSGKGYLFTRQMSYPLKMSHGKSIETQLPCFLPPFLPSSPLSSLLLTSLMVAPLG